MAAKLDLFQQYINYVKQIQTFSTVPNKRIASSGASLPKGDRGGSGKSRVEPGTVLGTTLRSMQQPMRRISWAASLCLPLPVDNDHDSNASYGEFCEANLSMIAS